MPGSWGCRKRVEKPTSLHLAGFVHLSDGIISYVLWKRQMTLHEGRHLFSTATRGRATKNRRGVQARSSIEVSAHRRRARTTLPSLIMRLVNGKPCPCLSGGLHSGVVNSSQVQSPVSIASKLDSLMMPDGSL